MPSTPVSELAISLPFKIDALGKVGATIDQPKIWADRVRSVIGTALSQRVYRPNFGCNAAAEVFDSEDIVIVQIETDISTAFSSFLSVLSLNAVNVSIDPNTQIVTADVEYSTPNGVEYRVQLGIATINSDGTVSEEFTWQIQ